MESFLTIVVLRSAAAKNMTSEKTTCPECTAKIGLESVALTPFFRCPFCDAQISVSPGYRRAQLWIVSILATVLPYLMGARWLILAVWFPALMLLAAIYAYLVKYLVPPKLVRYIPLAPRGSIKIDLS